jgi:hypothetical protein
MALWGFSKEGTVSASGANTEAGIKYGQQPFGGATDGRERWKRNVIVTSQGWVRRRNITKDGANSQRDEILVAANPGVSPDGYGNSAYLGFPEVSHIYLSTNSTGGNALQRSATANLYVVFNEPVFHKGGQNGYIRVRIANTAGGNTVIATANAKASTSRTDIINANNTLVFRFVPGVAGTYKLNSNTLTFGSVSGGAYTSNLVSLNVSGSGTTESANLVIAGSVSNNFGTFTVRSATTGG